MSCVATLLKECEKADIVGIGEHHHGELLSWKWRHLIAKHLKSKGYNVVVLLEQIQIYVDGLSKTPKPKFFFETINYNHCKAKKFYPHLMANAVSKEHLKITKEFAKLNIDMYGVDVAILRHEGLVNLIKDDYIKSIMLKQIQHWQTYSKRRRMQDGLLRNSFNANILLDVMNDKKRIDATTKILYFAHNEHVALDCEAHRNDPKYVTEGSILRSKLDKKYMSVGTFAPNMSSLWTFPDIYIDEANRKTQKQIVDDLKGKTYKIYKPDTCRISLDDYNNTDFDNLIVEPSVKTPTLMI